MAGCEISKDGPAHAPIILLEERARHSTLPEGVDAVVPLTAPEELLQKAEELVKAQEKK